MTKIQLNTVDGNPANHLGCVKPCKSWDKLPTSTGAGFLLSTVFTNKKHHRVFAKCRSDAPCASLFFEAPWISETQMDVSSWSDVFQTPGIQSYSQMMIGVSNHLLTIVFRFHYHSQEVIGSLGRLNSSNILNAAKKASLKKPLASKENKQNLTRGWLNL